MSEETQLAPTQACTKSTKLNPTRGSQLRKLLTCKSGATISQIQKAFNWQPHTARAAISGQRKAGWEIERSHSDKGAVDRIIGGVRDQ